MSVHPYTGHVCLDGEEYTDREIRVHIGYVPRFDSFIEYQTIREMLEFTAKMSLPDWVYNYISVFYFYYFYFYYFYFCYY